MDGDHEMRVADEAPERETRERERDEPRARDDDERSRRRDDSRDRGSRSERDRDSHSHRDRDRDSHRDHRDRDHRDRDRDDRRSSHRRRSYSRSRSPSPYRRRRHSASRSRSPDRDRERSHRHRRRSPSPSYRDREHGHSRDSFPRGGGRGGFRGRGGGGAMRGRGGFRGMPTAPTGPMNAPPEEAEAHSQVSVKENRLYVGNLAYDVDYKALADFMSGVGPVAFSEVLVTPAGMSKGCGIVEYVNTEDARRAKTELADTQFNGRAVFIREDREQNARFGAPPIPGKMGMALGEQRPAGFPAPGFGGPAAMGGMPNKSLFIGNVPPEASWQNLKDLFREAGEVIRADVGMTADGRPKGNGTVVYVTPESAVAAISMFNGYDWNGSILEVRFDRFNGVPRGGFRGGMRGAPFMRGGFAPGMRGAFNPGFRGGFAGGAMGMMPGGRSFTNDLYADYSGPGAEGEVKEEDMAGTINPMGSGLAPEPADPSAQILVRNLPWSTSNEDLVELFETTGTVLLAEILFEGSRSKGQGVVQFSEIPEAETASAKFTGYMYGGRPLDVQFNPTWHEFTESAAKGGQTAPMDDEAKAEA